MWCQAWGRAPDAAPHRLAGLHSHLPSPQAAPALPAWPRPHSGGVFTPGHSPSCFLLPSHLRLLLPALIPLGERRA